VKIKEGASLQGLNMNMRAALIAANRVWKTYGQELVITSGTDSAHSAGSLHYYGLAVDCRTRYFNDREVEAVKQALYSIIAHLGYDIFVHKTHIHIEYDPKQEDL
jgi:hypothetical protein